MIPQKEFDRSVPEDLKQKKRWVAWGPDPKTERPKCPLIISAKERRASTRKPETWSGFAAASAFYGKYGDGKTLGVGYVFALEDGLIYVDLDDVLDEHGELRAWAKPFVEPFVSRAYIELSPSGRGLHVIGRGTLPEGLGGGKMNFPQHASEWAKAKEKVPEVAIFSHGKYTTITGRVWKKHYKLGEISQATKQVWDLAGIHAVAVDGYAGPAPTDVDPEAVDKRKIPNAVKKELRDCKAADAEDRSAARFKLYVEAAERLDPEETYALVVSSEWYALSGAAEKGPEHTWADICRAYQKATTAAKEFEKASAVRQEETQKTVVAWKTLGVSVTTEMTKSGPVHKAVYGARNMAVVLARHPEWQGRIRLNQFKEQLELDGKVMLEHDIVHLAEAVRAYLGWSVEPNLDLAWKAAVVAGTENAYHPVQQYLHSLSWDKKGRIDDWLVRVGCEDTPLARLIGRKWIISLVARALRPGCKVDTVLVLEGAQGKKKSTVVETLVGGRDYFTDAHVTFDKDGQLIMHGSWVVELAELATFQKAEQLRTKQFLSSPDLTFRAPYGRVTVRRPRHFVLIGTTNDDEYLTDTTGNRRYWPVRVTRLKLDVEMVAVERDQLLAEAVVALEAGEPWWFDEEPEALEAARAERLQRDPLEDKVHGFLEQNVGETFGLSALMEFCGASPERKDLALRFAAILRGLGYEKRKTRVGGLAPRWVWYDASLDDGSGASAPVTSLEEARAASKPTGT